ncbi:MAG: right-handed parallel beta-helix repeat-containing protein [Anaerolineaceae bacterium]
MNTIRSAVLLLAALFLLTPIAANASFIEDEPVILYVTDAGSDADPCTRESPCTVQHALSLAVSGDQIWVAAGIYKTPVRSDSFFEPFALRNGVAMYGGYPNNGGDWTTRNWLENITILSGDEDSSGQRYSYHVVTSGSDIGYTTILDGFVITGGQANFGSDQHSKGGGLFNEGGSPTLSHLKFEDNRAGNGGGIYNNGGNPLLTNVTFFNNNGGDGGGMYNTSSNPSLTDVYFVENVTANNGGGMYNTASSPNLSRVTFTGNAAQNDLSSGYGGGIFNAANSNPVLNDVAFIANLADYGAGMYNNLSSPTLTDVTFSNNLASIDGGGILNNDQSAPNLSNVLFTSNSAGDAGGGMMNSALSNPPLSNVRFEGNVAVQGGGMVNSSSEPTLIDCNFNGNQASEGAGMSNSSSSPTLTRVSFSSNDGCGMSNSESSPQLTDVIFEGNSFGGMENSNSSNPVLVNVLFEGNSGPDNGGGMRNTYSSPSLTNVTFTGNSASSRGGAIYNYQESNPTLTNVTIANNSASLSGGGIMNYSNSGPVLTNVILWGNSLPQIFNWDAAQSIPIVSYSDVQGCGGSGGWNTACGTDSGGNIDADPRLAPMNNYGSFTRMYGLFPDSPVIDAGKPTDWPLTDQRNLARPVDGNEDGTSVCDIGAFEFNFESYLFLPVISR